MWGITRLATIATTDGGRGDVANPKHLGCKQRKLRRLEREKSRRQKGSNNRNKTRRKLGMAHAMVARARLSTTAGFGVGSRRTK
jgi:putative transposase